MNFIVGSICTSQFLQWAVTFHSFKAHILIKSALDIPSEFDYFLIENNNDNCIIIAGVQNERVIKTYTNSLSK